MKYEKVIRHFGSLAAAAKAMEITPGAVCQWRGKEIPEYRQLQLQRLSKGKLKADDAVRRKWETVI